MIGLLQLLALRVDSLYIAPHQDDEILSMGAAIMEEVRMGRRVVVTVATRGESSGVRTGSLATRLGYTPTLEEFSAGRDREFSECVRRMGAEPILLPYAGRQSDGSASAAAIALWIKGNFDPDVRLRTTGPTDYHADHRACGEAVTSLAWQGWGQDHRLFIGPWDINNGYWPSGVPMQKVGRLGEVTTRHTAAYQKVDLTKGLWGIGYLSVPARFQRLLSVDGASYWHAPSTAPEPEHALYGTALYGSSVYA